MCVYNVRLNYLCKNKATKMREQWNDIRVFFESGANGLIPQIRAGVVMNRLCFVKDGKLIEWNVVPVSVMRTYWQTLEQTMTLENAEILRSVCKHTLTLLPGPLIHCSICGWCSPQAEMWNDTVCSFCHNTKLHNTSFTFNNKPT